MPDPIGDYYRWLGSYMRRNEDEYMEYLMTGKIGETLIHCDNCRRNHTKECKIKTFKNELPGDLVTLEMRIKEDVRHILKAMFISSEDKKKILEDALESAILNADIRMHIEKQASECIRNAVEEYFKFGEGGLTLRKSINDALHETIPRLFTKL